MEKRLLVAVVLSMAILLGMQYLMQKFFPPAQPPLRTAQKETKQPATPLKSELSVAAPVALSQTSGTRRQLVIENADYRAVLDSRGAFLSSFQLKKYKNKSGQLLELVPQKIPADFFPPYPPLALDVPGKPPLTERANQAPYEVRLGNKRAKEDHFFPPVNLTFLYADNEIQVQKELKFYPDKYFAEVSAKLWENGQPRDIALLLGPDIGTEADEAESDFQRREVVVNRGGSIQRELLSKGKTQSYNEPVLWAGFDTKYFAALAIPVEQYSSLKVERFDVKQKDASGKENFIPYYHIYCPADSKPVKVYLGPKDHDALNAVKPGLAAIIDYGWFSFLVQPLLLSLKYIHRFAGNWGVAIIALTFLISLALFPIRYKQMVSMKKMQALQPKMRSIQDRYKKYKRTDPKRQEMNTEIMNLYKEHGVNPLGGCLPLVLQMPFLFAFYRMLDASLELRGAPFFLWIHDLAKMDPYYVTPILMGVSMLVQQKLTPQTTADPAQARMMMMMPIVFTAMFLTLSSGLVLYFLFSNLFAVGFQKLAEQWMQVENETSRQNRKKVKGAKE